ncbi:amino acid permease [Salinibacterium sp. UTAS2018]|uniref:APC family permease n=1 Tax=Salinibacterium sp. UTAS2018 TaxID=2508880 RepID=UPI0010095265|nr:APC family permease [Salinibacterium sp. UTAS2018]QAV69395.1 amino acid permease [Salinibacterium sp. UTAS2018]
MTTTAPLARRLSVFDATVIGIGSMVGAGVFAAFAPAALAAGSGLLIGLAIAALVAWLNASASAQLAAVYPFAGGTYVYGRERLGPWWGFFAGWSFVVGKTASCAAMALICAAYIAPAGFEKLVAVLAVVVVTVVNLSGISRTAAATKVIVMIVVAVLIGVMVLALVAANSSTTWLAVQTEPAAPNAYGILQSAGILFFAFAGYARIATLGEEVRDPQRSIPRAIMGALAIAVVLYAAIGATLLTVLGPHELGMSRAPISDLLSAAGWGDASPLVAGTAALASLGALLALMAGIGRTTLAMARTRDLPRWLDAVHPRFSVPHRAELVVAALVIVIVLIADVRGAIAFSSFGVLLYYFVANVAAFTQPAAQRRVPRAVNIVGATACLLLVATVPPVGIIVGVIVVATGIPVRLLSHRQSRPVFTRGT